MHKSKKKETQKSRNISEYRIKHDGSSDVEAFIKNRRIVHVDSGDYSLAGSSTGGYNSDLAYLQPLKTQGKVATNQRFDLAIRSPVSSYLHYGKCRSEDFEKIGTYSLQNSVNGYNSNQSLSYWERGESSRSKERKA